MGNLVGNCVPIVPSEGTAAHSSGGGKDTADAVDGVEGGGERPPERPEFKSELEGINEPPTTITLVLSNALYAMEFHKHLALT